MARYVIKITESKESYYCLLVREKCSRGLIEDAYTVIREMVEVRCAPNTKVYNYLLSSLWKNGRMDEASGLLDEMKEIGISPDAITFEILINFSCSSGNMDHVHQLLDQMVSQGLEPRQLMLALSRFCSLRNNMRQLTSMLLSQVSVIRPRAI
ncbi:UNVERIFIED_CONTAM: hypothetical protein Sradi_3682500 [Sesamum radiatum]|uniref:Pentatricopeptide repeat-containing protein n=1 Tax=Sesamum radiatum TaxID=300843 RepID=A0AAW2PWR9_SESRA